MAVYNNDTISYFYVLSKNVKNPLKSMISEGDSLKCREQTYKPGSVLDSHLSWSVVANSIMRLLLKQGEQP